MENHEHAHTDSIYSCPMHPEIIGKKGGSCSKCGMELVPKAINSSTVEVQLITSPQAVEAGSPAKLEFTFKNGGRNVQLDVAHEKYVHLMVISDDLTWFRHIHPEEQAGGSYVVTETFPVAGKYLLFTDFKPNGAAPIVNRQEIEVKGDRGDTKEDYSDKFISETGGYKVTLENGNDFKTNRTQSLEISIEKDGKKLSEKDIQQYLGATAHIVMTGKADKEYLHIHPMSGKQFPVYAETHIEKPGIYRIWVEFQVNDRVHTADFTVKVPKGNRTNNEEHRHMH